MPKATYFISLAVFIPDVPNARPHFLAFLSMSPLIKTMTIASTPARNQSLNTLTHPLLLPPIIEYLRSAVFNSVVTSSSPPSRARMLLRAMTSGVCPTPPSSNSLVRSVLMAFSTSSASDRIVPGKMVCRRTGGSSGFAPMYRLISCDSVSESARSAALAGA